MRYIGNKTRLLDFIGEVLDEHGIAGDGAHAVDAFAGTASVGRFLKRRGFRVTTCDIMTYSHLLSRVGVELDGVPQFEGLRGRMGALPQRWPDEAGSNAVGGDRDVVPGFRITGSAPPEAPLAAVTLAEENDQQQRALLEVLHYLNESITPRESLITREYSAYPNGEGRRMYFTRSNAERIDAVRETIDEWHGESLLSSAERDTLIASLLEAMDAVANTTGVYAAYVKSWQPNALRPLTLRPPQMTPTAESGSRALRGDINQIVPQLGRMELLYLDPPYNNRQYSSYYHLPELVAIGWQGGEPELRGKTGLIPDSGKRSDWSKKGRCVDALNDLLGAVDTKYVLMSYNSEGIIPESEIHRAFKRFGKPETFRVHERDYARYRSDRDGVGRNYKARSVAERVYFVEKKER